MPASLHVWMNGRHVGVWTHARGTSSFQYDPVWAAAADRRRLSLSLDFQPGNAPHKGAVVENYFDNLLPDSEPIRKRLQSRFGTDSREAFDLLAAIGRDCVGAVQLLPEGEEPSGVEKINAEPLDDAEVEQAISAALSDGRVFGQSDNDDFRISLAGAQEKTALLRYKDRWCRPVGATPTTHIFKLPLGVVGNLQIDLSDSVENEWLCLKLLAAFGLETATAEIARFGKHQVLIVERFDRVWQGSKWIARRPQEDFCQALGIAGWKKYENQGGPGMADILHTLAFSADAARNRRTFVKAQVVFWLLAATDGHAKNFSLFHERGGTYRLTPLYDVLSAWPIVGPGRNQLPWQKASLAMAVRATNAHWKLKDIRPRHWSAVAKQAGLGDADALIHEILSLVPTALSIVDALLPKNFPAHVSDKIFAGIEQQAKVLAAG
jgi:serine/threonine-protein kinase HipA